MTHWKLVGQMKKKKRGQTEFGAKGNLDSQRRGNKRQVTGRLSENRTQIGDDDVVWLKILCVI